MLGVFEVEMKRIVDSHMPGLRLDSAVCRSVVSSVLSIRRIGAR
jgi:hypothetical protein